jgi:methylthioribose-1-phosphate isomerase
VTDAAAPGCIAAGGLHAVLVGADRIAANGDVVSSAGAYPLALAARVAGVPFIVCATSSAIDETLLDGADATLEEGRPGPVVRVGTQRIVPEGTAVLNRLQDLVPGALVTAIVTEHGVRPPHETPVA